MNIKLANRSHKQELTELWAEAFGDDEKFISSFLDAYMIPEYNVPIAIENNKIVSALYLVDFDLYSETKVLGSCAYLFAAATKKGSRNQGCMSALVRYSAGLCANRGLKAVFLFPQAQNEKLFAFYSKFGFKPIYAAKLLNRRSGEKKDFTGFGLKHENIADAVVFDALYDAYAAFTAKQHLAPMKDRLFYFRCASEYLQTPENASAKTYFAVFFNNVEKFCYVFYKKYMNTFYIDDIIVPDSKKSFSETADLLAGYILNTGDNVTLTMNMLPTSMTDAGNVPLAMLLPLTRDVKNIADALKTPVYINMFMNL